MSGYGGTIIEGESKGSQFITSLDSQINQQISQALKKVMQMMTKKVESLIDLKLEKLENEALLQSVERKRHQLSVDPSGSLQSP